MTVTPTAFPGVAPRSRRAPLAYRRGALGLSLVEPPLAPDISDMAGATGARVGWLGAGNHNAVSFSTPALKGHRNLVQRLHAPCMSPARAALPDWPRELSAPHLRDFVHSIPLFRRSAPPRRARHSSGEPDAISRRKDLDPHPSHLVKPGPAMVTWDLVPATAIGPESRPPPQAPHWRDI